MLFMVCTINKCGFIDLSIKNILIIPDCAQSTSVMSTNVLAFLLLTRYRDGASLEELVKALDDLRIDLKYARRDIGFTGDSIDVINYAVSLFSSMPFYRLS